VKGVISPKEEIPEIQYDGSQTAEEENYDEINAELQGQEEEIRAEDLPF